jgi:hypothetical protein
MPDAARDRTDPALHPTGSDRFAPQIRYPEILALRLNAMMDVAN